MKAGCTLVSRYAKVKIQVAADRFIGTAAISNILLNTPLWGASSETVR